MTHQRHPTINLTNCFGTSDAISVIHFDLGISEREGGRKCCSHATDTRLNPGGVQFWVLPHAIVTINERGAIVSAVCLDCANEAVSAADEE
jgi:hypothetical protein